MAGIAVRILFFDAPIRFLMLLFVFWQRWFGYSTDFMQIGLLLFFIILIFLFLRWRKRRLSYVPLFIL